MLISLRQLKLNQREFKSSTDIHNSNSLQLLLCQQ